MKRFTFIILLSILVISAKAQNFFKDKISFATTVGTEIPTNTPSTVPFTWQVLGYYHLTDRWSFGAGTGLSIYEKTLIPVYGDVKYQIGRERKFTPFVELALGYSFAASSSTNGGAFANPSIGVEYPLKNKIKLQLAVGYTGQEFKRLKQQTDGYFHKEFAEKLCYNSVSFRLGLRF